MINQSIAFGIIFTALSFIYPSNAKAQDFDCILAGIGQPGTRAIQQINFPMKKNRKREGCFQYYSSPNSIGIIIMENRNSFEPNTAGIISVNTTNSVFNRGGRSSISGSELSDFAKSNRRPTSYGEVSASDNYTNLIFQIIPPTDDIILRHYKISIGTNVPMNGHICFISTSQSRIMIRAAFLGARNILQDAILDSIGLTATNQYNQKTRIALRTLSQYFSQSLNEYLSENRSSNSTYLDTIAVSSIVQNSLSETFGDNSAITYAGVALFQAFMEDFNNCRLRPKPVNNQDVLIVPKSGGFWHD